MFINMRDARHHNGLLFNSFVVTVVLAHLTQLVWNLPHPLLPQRPLPSSAITKSMMISPFDEPEDSSSSETGDDLPEQQARNGGRNKETREIHDRQLDVGGGGTHCSLLQTILDPRNCRIGHHHPPRHFAGLEDSPESFIDGRHEDSLLESNNIVPPSPHGDHYYPYHHQQQQQYHHGPFLPPSPDGDDNIDSRLENHRGSSHQQIPLDENGNEDETKIIRSKTMIIVPERSCPPGKRRDIRGYCRTVYRFPQQQQSYGNQPPPPRGNNGPVRLYYRRYVAVPTLHFILP